MNQNVRLLNEKVQNLNKDELFTFYTTFLASLSQHIPPEIWIQCLESANIGVESGAYKTLLDVSGIKYEN